MARKATRLSDVRRARARRERPDWVPSADNARREVRRMRMGRYRRHRQNVAFFIAVFSFALGYLLFSLGFELVTVQGTGMHPTLESGSMVLCVKQSALDKLVGLVPENLRRLQRNDLMLIHYRVAPDGEVHKRERSVLLIKRAAAMAGVSTRVSREKLRNTASLFIRPISCSPIMPFVASIAGTWIVR